MSVTQLPIPERRVMRRTLPDPSVHSAVSAFMDLICELPLSDQQKQATFAAAQRWAGAARAAGRNTPLPKGGA